ncbi:SRPBCC family protein [Actinocorallia sp. A-T 12471]|uniref:SRPBCC family protein n=1 Tax=Actinocorallia sp. A-T 12471 TaxID=3089813 RepID=UPI0029D395FC|nr:SRPBCC family protein [Actinocorallia sp. A-T 12471]MDX6742983.1 SRPBCC family protein [Actinocorallia sp. A-T 12471]
MTATTTGGNRTQIEADPALPTIKITRDFDGPPELVYRIWADPDLVARWLGPRSIDNHIHTWDLRRGGSYRYTSTRDGEEIAAFYGSFHEVRENERIVQTFTYEGWPDGVCLETITFEDLGDGRTRTTTLSVTDTMEARDGMIASGMESGVVEGYEKIDEIISEQTADQPA